MYESNFEPDEQVKRSQGITGFMEMKSWKVAPIEVVLLHFVHKCI